MKKKILMVLLALTCVTGSVPAAVITNEPVEAAAAVKSAKKKTPTLKQLYSAVKKAYGKNYLPSVKLDTKDIETRYGIKESWYKDAVAEVPMMSAQVDQCVIVRAKNSNAKKKTKKALQSYQKALREDRFQYPANQLKIQGSRVYVKGNYVCFFMLGSIDKKTEESPDESKVIDAYREQNKKAVNAIKKLYK